MPFSSGNTHNHAGRDGNTVGNAGVGAGPDPLAHVDVNRVRETLLWCARALTGHGFYLGRRIAVTISLGDESFGVFDVTVRPRGNMVGLVPPCEFRPPVPVPVPTKAEPADVPSGPGTDTLLRHFLGDGERIMLATIAEKGPCRTGDLETMLEGKVTRSEFYPIKKNLTARELIRERSDGRVEVSAGWVRALVAGNCGG